MRKFGVKQVIPILTALVGAAFLCICLTQYGFWDELKGPTKGFFPTIIAAGLLIASVFAFMQSFKEQPVKLPKMNFLVIAAGFGMFLLSYVIGLLPTLAVYMVLWLKLVEHTPWKIVIILTAVVMAVIVGAFGIWLDIQFPMGMIYEYFAG